MNKKIVIYANGWNGDNLSHYMEGLKEGLEGGAVDLHVFLGHDAYGLDETDNKAESCIYDETIDAAVKRADEEMYRNKRKMKGI